MNATDDGARYSPARRQLDSCEAALLAAKTGIWEHDVRTGHVRTHSALLRVLGYQANEVPADFEEWNRSTLHPDDLASWQGAYQRHLDGETEIYEHTHRRLHRDGCYRWLFSRGKVERDSRGRPVRMMGIASDVTEFRQMQDSLRQSQDRMREIAEYTSDVYCLLEADSGKVLYLSPTFERIWGYPAAYVLDGTRRWIDAVPEEDRARLRSMDLGSRCDSWDVSYRLIRPDGGIRWVQTRGFPILKEGAPDRIAGVIKDITEERADDERRLDVLRQQSELLVREVHHRIKNSMQGVSGLLTIRMREQPQLVPLLAEALMQIESVALVHGLQGNQDRRGGGDIDTAIMTRAIVETARRFALPDVQVALEIKEPVHRRVASDKGVAVALVLNELLTNALKHCQVQGGATVRVTLAEVDDRVRWRISNPGALSRALDLVTGQGLGTGLNLARSMLPAPGANLRIEGRGGNVLAQLELNPPVIVPEEA